MTVFLCFLGRGAAKWVKKNNNLIFTVEEGNFVPYKKANKEESDEDRKGFVKEEYKGNDKEASGEFRKGFVKGVYTGTDNGNSVDYHPEPPRSNSETWLQRNSKWIFAILGTLVVFEIVFVIWYGFKSSSGENSGNDSGGGKTTNSSSIEHPKAPETFVANSVQLTNYTKPIESELDLKPTPLYNGDPNKTTTVASEITLELSGVGTNNAKIRDNTLIVTPRPKIDTKVTVIAKLNGKELGRQEYTIAKKVEEKKDTSKVDTASKIPTYKGQERTIDQYISDLESTLKKDASRATWVQNECQKIINGEYGIEYKNNDKAIVLRDKAKNTASYDF